MKDLNVMRKATEQIQALSWSAILWTCSACWVLMGPSRSPFPFLAQCLYPCHSVGPNNPETAARLQNVTGKSIVNWREEEPDREILLQRQHTITWRSTA